MLRLGIVLLLTIYFINVGLAQDFLDTTHNHLKVCYEDTRYTLNRHLPPFNLDNLLAIIEKIENNRNFPQSTNAQYVATFILRKFRVDGITSDRLTENQHVPNYIQDHAEYLRGKLILGVLPQPGFENIPLHFLSDDEKCALHWMVSHSINKTRLKEEDNFNWRPSTVSPYPRFRRQSSFDQNKFERSEFSRFPREMGVIYTPQGEAVAAGSLLAGVALGKDSGTLKLNEIDRSIDTQTGYGDFRISKLDAATYAINFALDAKSKKFNLGPKGIWNSTLCPTEYTLEDVATAVPDALVYGSFDGYLIGEHLKDSESMLLSQILRMYYSTGFPTNREKRSCKRSAQIVDLSNENFLKMIPEVGKAIILLGHAAGGTKNLTAANEIASNLFEGIGKNYTLNTYVQTECGALDATTELKIYPLIDLYVVADRSYFRSQTQYDDMARFIAYTAEHLDISLNTSHIGVYIEDKALFDSFMPINASLSKAAFKCKLLNFDIRNVRLTGSSDQSIETIRLLKQMLIDIKTHNNNRDIAGRAAPVVLFMRGSGAGDDIKWEMEHFRKDHPEVRVLAAARSRSDVQAFLGDERANSHDFIQYMPNTMSVMVEALFRNHLRRIGSAIYFPFCERTEARSFDVAGYLRPFTRQFHTMPSSMFNLSTELKIEIRAQGVALEACISREDELFKNNRVPSSATCFEAATSGQTTPLFFGDPCSAQTPGFCKPIYIQVKRKDFKEKTLSCMPTGGSENLCRTAEDARYTIRVENGRCNGCTFKITMSLFLLSVIVSFI